MNFYKIILLRSSAPDLTYCSRDTLAIGTVVTVPLKTTVKEAVILAEVVKPTFETAEIVSVSDRVYSPEQMEIAKFISEYYFSSFSEAISLFLPFPIGCRALTAPLNSFSRFIAPAVNPISVICITQKSDKSTIAGAMA